MTQDYTLWNLREVAEALMGVIRRLEMDSDYGDEELAIAMNHLYHHLNTAWNARHASTERIDQCSPKDFLTWRQFPADIDMTLV